MTKTTNLVAAPRPLTLEEKVDALANLAQTIIDQQEEIIEKLANLGRDDDGFSIDRF